MGYVTPDFHQRLQRLDTLLQHYAWLWRPQPYKELEPSWCARLPALKSVLLALSDAEVERYAADTDLMLRVVDAHVPGVAELVALSHLPALPSVHPLTRNPHLEGDVPGRKLRQITAFAETVSGTNLPLLEWCGGKGHLGRIFADQRRISVTTLERDAALCASGMRLARRARVEQVFHVVDVLTQEAAQYLAQHHAIALHACGELHRTLLRQAVDTRTPALDISPCCYHLGTVGAYRSFSGIVQLVLFPDDLRMAVTETVTAAPRETRKRDREMAWKLAFEQLCREVSGVTAYRSVPPIDKQWLELGFAEFIRRLARREGVHLPEHLDVHRFEALGWRRQRDVMRLSLPRSAFRRALEMWLVLDMAASLVDHGYHVSLGKYCSRSLTPRNILLSARLANSAT
ncbi:MAG: methyltransferase [Pseudomonadota bacterium]